MPTPQAHASSAAQALDDADGVRDGKFYGRQIVQKVNPLFEDNITPQGHASGTGRVGQQRGTMSCLVGRCG